MVASTAVMVGLLLTLWLPIYPEHLSGPIVAFGGLAALGGGAALLQRPAWNVLVYLLPWTLAVGLGLVVGSVGGGDPRQGLEDALPYALFALGLVAGRGVADPTRVLLVALGVCVADGVISLAKMPSFEPGMRSTYGYFKITAGLPLVGLFLVGLFATGPRRSFRLTGIARVVLGSILVVALVATVSRGMIFSAASGLALAAHLRRPSLLWATAALGAAVWFVLGGELAALGVQYLRLGDLGTVSGRVREVHAALAAFAERPLFGHGLGTHIEVDGARVSFVHNVIAYHLWKCGVAGTALLALPLLPLAAGVARLPRGRRALLLGAGVAVAGYLVTSAAYKTYYLVWIYGVVVGATVRAMVLEQHRRRTPTPSRARPALGSAANQRPPAWRAA